jgi:hypothetical protein
MMTITAWASRRMRNPITMSRQPLRTPGDRYP